MRIALPFTLALLVAATVSPRYLAAQHTQGKPATQTLARPAQGKPSVQSRPISSGKAKPSAPVRPRTMPRNYGLRADSINGISGHVFGEPRSRFPELETKGFMDLGGYMYYEVKLGAEAGWFGKNSERVRTIYRFYQDKFAAFDAKAYGQDRSLLLEQALYLFGPGQPISPKQLAFGEAGLVWEGQKVSVQLSDGHNATGLYILSKVVAAQKAADELAQKKRDTEARAAQQRADNGLPPR